MFSSHLGSWRTGTVRAGEDSGLLCAPRHFAQWISLLPRTETPPPPATELCDWTDTEENSPPQPFFGAQRFWALLIKPISGNAKGGQHWATLHQMLPCLKTKGASARNQGHVLRPHFPPGGHRQPEGGGICSIWLGCPQPRALNRDQQVRNTLARLSVEHLLC